MKIGRFFIVEWRTINKRKVGKAVSLNICHKMHTGVFNEESSRTPITLAEKNLRLNNVFLQKIYLEMIYVLR